MGLNGGVRNFIEVIFEPTDSSDMTGGRGVFSGQRIARKRGQGKELTRLWTLFWTAQVSHVIRDTDDWFCIGWWRRSYSGVMSHERQKMVAEPILLH